MRLKITLCPAHRRRILLRKFAAFENALYDTATEHGERALRHGFTNC
jgi:hypothetical protein